MVSLGTVFGIQLKIKLLEVKKIVNNLTYIPPLQRYGQEIQECDRQQMESDAQEEEEIM